MSTKQRIEFHSPDGFSYSSQSGSEADAPKLAIWAAVGIAAVLLAALPLVNAASNADELQRLQGEVESLEREKEKVEAERLELNRRKDCAISVLSTGEGCPDG